MSRRRSLEVIEKSETVTIGELARLTDIRYSTLKHYTEEGLLPFIQEGENLTRRYPREKTLDRLEEILKLREKNMAIKDIVGKFGLKEKDSLASIFLSLLEDTSCFSKTRLEKLNFIIDSFEKEKKLVDKLERKKLPPVSNHQEKNIYSLREASTSPSWDENTKLFLWALNKLDSLDYIFSRFEIEKIEERLVELKFHDPFIKKLYLYKI